MGLQIVSPGESLATNLTRKRQSSSVKTNMPDDRRRIRRDETAEMAEEPGMISAVIVAAPNVAAWAPQLDRLRRTKK